MKRIGWLGLVAAASLGSNCPQAPKTPAATQPRVANVRLVGQRVCGRFQADRQWDFTCDPLPTQGASGWQLTPAWGTDAQNRPKANKIAVITLTAQTLTDLRVDFEPSATATWTLRQKPPGPGQPLSVTARGEVEVDKSDDGTTRTWTVTANVWLCSREVPLKFYSVGADGSLSNGTIVVLLRPDEGQCEYSTGGGGGFGMSRTGPADPSPRPSNPPTQGPCPGGAPRTLFGICENCTNPPDPKFNDWTGVEACSWDEVLMTFDYKNPDGTPRFPKSNYCRPPRQTDRVSCEGP